MKKILFLTLCLLFTRNQIFGSEENNNYCKKFLHEETSVDSWLFRYCPVIAKKFQERKLTEAKAYDHCMHTMIEYTKGELINKYCPNVAKKLCEKKITENEAIEYCMYTMMEATFHAQQQSKE